MSGVCQLRCDDLVSLLQLAHTTPVNAPEAGFSEVHVSEEEGGLEIQEQKVAPEQGNSSSSPCGLLISSLHYTLMGVQYTTCCD